MIKLILSFVVITLASCASTPAHLEHLANDKCPITKEQLKEVSPTSTFEGKTVGFCCTNCQSKFNGMKTLEKRSKLSAVAH
jgi:hypothetical protein